MREKERRSRVHILYVYRKCIYLNYAFIVYIHVMYILMHSELYKYKQCTHAYMSQHDIHVSFYTHAFA